MKKALAEVDNHQLASELETRLACIEARLEKLDPTPKLESREPFKIGSNVYSIVDLEARNPYVVRGYKNGRILLVTSPGEQERELPIESVVPFEKCKNAQTSTDQAREDMFARMDPKTREFCEGRRDAEIAARKNELPPRPRPQQRYM